MRLAYLDANVVISIVELSSPLSPAQLDFIAALDRGDVDAVTSELTLAECLVKPMADRNLVTVSAYLQALDGRPPLLSAPISHSILVSAARVRAESGMKLPDAIHIATALDAGCDLFITNDRRIKTFEGLEKQLWDRLTVKF